MADEGGVKQEFQGNQGDGNRGGFRGRGGRGGRGRGEFRGGRGGSRWNRDNNSGGGRRNLTSEENDGDNIYGSNSGGGGGGNEFRGNNERSDRKIKNEEPQEKKEPKKFTGRCRLFVGNIANDMEDSELKDLFTPHGEVAEVFVSKGKGFGFVRLDTRIHAQIAKEALDGTEVKGRTLRVRFASHGAALKVTHLPNNVSNELLEEAFAEFGEIERALVIVDERGRSTGEGIVEFARRPGASKAIQACTEGVLLLTSSPRPVTVEPLPHIDDEDGLPERLIPRNHQYHKDRSTGPRYPLPGSFEFEFGQRWKQLYEMEAKEKERLKKEMEDAIEKLEMEMAGAQHDHQAKKLREELRRIEELKLQDERRLMEMMARREQEEQDRRRIQEQQQQKYGMMRGGFNDRMGMGGGGQMNNQMNQMNQMNEMAGGGGGGRRELSQGDIRDMVRQREERNAEAESSDKEGNNGTHEGQQQGQGQQQRQSRFDQPPENFRGVGLMLQNRDLMRERMMERRDNRPREEFHDNKRGRRF